MSDMEPIIKWVDVLAYMYFIVSNMFKSSAY